MWGHKDVIVKKRAKGWVYPNRSARRELKKMVEVLIQQRVALKQPLALSSTFMLYIYYYLKQMFALVPYT